MEQRDGSQRRSRLLLRILWVGALIGLMSIVAACGGGGESPGGASPGGQTDSGGGGGTQVASAGDPARGQTLYTGSCVSCHGPDGRGITGLGKQLSDSDFVGSRTDAELVEFIRVGRRANDPANTTGIDMPPKGGNPSLTDADLLDIVAYLRTLQN